MSDELLKGEMWLVEDKDEWTPDVWGVKVFGVFFLIFMIMELLLESVEQTIPIMLVRVLVFFFAILWLIGLLEDFLRTTKCKNYKQTEFKLIPSEGFVRDYLALKLGASYLKDEVSTLGAKITRMEHQRKKVTKHGKR